jgi:hypothetical protein
MLDDVPAIVGTYGTVAADLSADWYDQARYEAAAPGRFAAAPAAVPSLEQIRGSVRWAVGPLWTPEPNPAAALKNLSASTLRLMRYSARQTILDATLADPARPRYVRVTSGSACGFCAMLAARGAVYHEGHAEFHAHDHCHCTAEPSFGDEELPAANRRYAALWRQASDAEGDTFSIFRQLVEA